MPIAGPRTGIRGHQVSTWMMSSGGIRAAGLKRVSGVVGRGHQGGVIDVFGVADDRADLVVDQLLVKAVV